MPIQHRHAHARRMWRLLLKAFALAAVGLFIARLNIFNTDHASQDASTATFLRLVAHWSAINDRLDGEPVAVVFYDVDQLEQMGHLAQETWTWPLTFTQHARFLDKLIGYDPQAIFFDIAFYQQRPGENDFAQAIKRATGVKAGDKSCAVRNSGRVPDVSIFLAKLPGRTILPSLCEAGAEGVGVRWDSRPYLYPLQSCDNPDDFRPGGLEDCHEKREMAATRLWRDWCVAHKSHPSCRARSSPDAHQDALLSLTWGFSPHPEQWRFPEYSCDPARSYLAGGLWTEISSWLGLVRSDLVYSTCPSPLTIPASRILFGNDDDKKALSRLLQDRLVLVAANVPGLRDPLPSPVHQNLPGVFTHAAAVDNLIRFPGATRFEARPDYFEEEHEGVLKTLGSFFIIFAALALTLWCVETIDVERKTLAELAYSSATPGWRRFYRPLATLLGLIATSCGVVALTFVIALVLFWGLRIAPINWAEIAVVIILLALPEILSAARYALLELTFRYRSCRRFAQRFFPPPHKENQHD
jgi:CHASE2 domain-containing sensor protein